MNAKKQVALLGSVVLLIFSSCRKDLVQPEDQMVKSEVLSSDATANDVAETEPPIHTPITTYVNDDCAGYYETLPARYNLTTKKYPLIIFIHGIGELGTGVTRLNCCGIPYWAQRKLLPPEYVVNGVHYSFVMISPQFKLRPTPAQIQSVVNYAVNKYRVDQSRIYITGLSMGGGSAWDYSAVYGQNAAAAVPVCGGTAPTTTLAQNVASKNLPIWTISSEGDQVVPIQWARNWVSWIKQDNPAIASKTKLTEWVTEDHNATWGRAFNPQTRVDGMNIYEWMLQFTRGGVAAIPPPSSGNSAPVAHAGSDQTIPMSWNYSPLLNGTTSSDADGWIKSFAWSKVSGPSSYAFANARAGQTKITGLTAGTYVFRLTVTDNDGATGTDDVTITMTSNGTTTPVTTAPEKDASGNTLPIANAGADKTLYLSSGSNRVLLNGTLSKDTDGWLTKYEWARINGPIVATLSNTSVGQAYVNNLIAGDYTYRLKVTDNKGAYSYDYVDIKVLK